MAISGGCLCGKVRFEIAAEAPLAARQCWCRVCQYLSAGAGMSNAVFPKDAITVTGETAVFASIADSGAVMRRSFCPTCGTPLFSEAEPRPHQIIVRVGSLDDREARQAGRDHLDAVGAQMGLLRPGAAAGRGAAARRK